MKKISPEEAAMLGTTIAIDLSRGKTTAELNVIRNIASQISSVIFTIISQRVLNDEIDANINFPKCK